MKGIGENIVQFYNDYYKKIAKRFFLYLLVILRILFEQANWEVSDKNTKWKRNKWNQHSNIFYLISFNIILYLLVVIGVFI